MSAHLRYRPRRGEVGAPPPASDPKPDPEKVHGWIEDLKAQLVEAAARQAAKWGGGHR